MRPIIALLTDFGTRDHYVGALKGAILSVAADAQIVDIVHDLVPHDIEGGAFALAAAYRAFPAGTVFVGVVDPGVGSARRGLAVTAGVYRFVGPDNGILSAAFDDHPTARAYGLADPRFWRDQVSRTFHGRDIFGPVAAHLAAGVAIETMGPLVAAPQRLSTIAVTAVAPDEWQATVVHVDRFGNLTTNVAAAVLAGIVPACGGPAAVLVRLGRHEAPLVETYGDVPMGQPCALLGSSGRLEIAVNGGSAAAVLGGARGTAVHIRRRDPSAP